MRCTGRTSTSETADAHLEEKGGELAVLFSLRKFLYAWVFLQLLFRVPSEAFLEVRDAIAACWCAWFETEVLRSRGALSTTFGFLNGGITDVAPFLAPPFFIEDGNCLRLAFRLLLSCVMPLLLDGFAWL